MRKYSSLLVAFCWTVASLWPATDCLALPSQDVPELDPYGGDRALQAPGGATGYFRLDKIGNRWTFVTPEGHALWLRAVYTVHWVDGGEAYRQRVATKYPKLDFYPQAVRRLRSWGFNALGEYSDLYALPVGTYNGKEGNPEKMPFLITANASLYGIRGGAFKNLYHGVNTSLHPSVYIGIFPDVFDPAFTTFVDQFIRDPEHVYNGAEALNASPWLIGVTTDDGDYSTGFGPGPDAEASQSKTHPHLGWVAAVASPVLTRAALDGVPITFKDPKIYTKYAFRDFLRTKYGSLTALNAAWKASYTTWDSDGSWPNGRGVLDESGRNPWIGGDYDVTGQSGQVKADLDELLFAIADRYFAVYATKIRAHLSNHLVFSPATMQAGTRVPILRAAGRHLDAVQTSGVPLGPSYPWFRRIYEVAGKPVFVWTTFTAQQDAGLVTSDRTGWGPAYNKPTQSVRGEAYVQEIDDLLSLRAANGDYFVLGINWWEWSDKVVGGENMNFGLVTVRDNAYDGKEAVAEQGLDQNGHPIGGEKKNYGNFLTAVTRAHQMVDRRLHEELSKATKGIAKP